jgi:hypothetical protein
MAQATKMDEKDKRKIVTFVGLCVHEWVKWDEIEPKGWGFAKFCKHCKEGCHLGEPQLDPTDPADMYGKIWPAFQEKGWQAVDEFLACDVFDGLGICEITPTLTSASLLAQALLDYIEQKEGE